MLKNLRISNNNPRATCFGLILVQFLDYDNKLLIPEGLELYSTPYFNPESNSHQQRPTGNLHVQYPLEDAPYCVTFVQKVRLVLKGLLLLHSLKKRTKNDTRGPDRVEIYHEIVLGLELAARHHRTLERAGSYPNSNRRPIVSDCSLFR